jgi:hypothetical protein
MAMTDGIKVQKVFFMKDEFPSREMVVEDFRVIHENRADKNKKKQCISYFKGGIVMKSCSHAVMQSCSHAVMQPACLAWAIALAGRSCSRAVVLSGSLEIRDLAV